MSWANPRGRLGSLEFDRRVLSATGWRKGKTLSAMCRVIAPARPFTLGAKETSVTIKVMTMLKVAIRIFRDPWVILYVLLFRLAVGSRVPQIFSHLRIRVGCRENPLLKVERAILVPIAREARKVGQLFLGVV